jgi:hypothetical protein
MSPPNQDPCQSRKTAENAALKREMGDFANQELVDFATLGLEHSPRPARRITTGSKGAMRMIGKLFGAWLGEKVAGPNRGAKGAILGYGAAALARRSVPALAAVALGGWAFRKYRGRRRREAPAYPSEAAPSPPSSD